MWEVLSQPPKPCIPQNLCPSLCHRMVSLNWAWFARQENHGKSQCNHYASNKNHNFSPSCGFFPLRQYQCFRKSYLCFHGKHWGLPCSTAMRDVCKRGKQAKTNSELSGMINTAILQTPLKAAILQTPLLYFEIQHNRFHRRNSWTTRSSYIKKAPWQWVKSDKNSKKAPIGFFFKFYGQFCSWLTKVALQKPAHSQAHSFILCMHDVILARM